MSVTVISLGESDSMSNELTRLGLKGPHSLFEGVVSGEFKDVLAVLKIVAEGKDIPVTTREDCPGNKFLADTQILTCLYEDVDFDVIVKERVAQLKADLSKDIPVVFVREDTPDTVTKEDIDAFMGVVKQIAPACVCKLVIFSRAEDHVEMANDVVVHTKFDAEKNKQVILGCFEVVAAPVVEVAVEVVAPVEAAVAEAAVEEAAAPVEEADVEEVAAPVAEAPVEEATA